MKRRVLRGHMWVLDHVESISLDPARPVLANPHSLHLLAAGLHQMAVMVREDELAKIQDGLVFASGGDHEGTIQCMHPWFAVSLHNYLRLVGLVGLMTQRGWATVDVAREVNRKVVKDHCTDYAKAQAREVTEWRHKVGAHPAVTDPRGEDVATLEQSIMAPAMYVGGRWRATGGQWCTKGQVSQLPSWSITEEFERLRPRFWPERALPDGMVA